MLLDKNRSLKKNLISFQLLVQKVAHSPFNPTEKSCYFHKLSAQEITHCFSVTVLHRNVHTFILSAQKVSHCYFYIVCPEGVTLLFLWCLARRCHTVILMVSGQKVSHLFLWCPPRRCHTVVLIVSTQKVSHCNCFYEETVLLSQTVCLKVTPLSVLQRKNNIQIVR